VLFLERYARRTTYSEQRGALPAARAVRGRRGGPRCSLGQMPAARGRLARPSSAHCSGNTSNPLPTSWSTPRRPG